MESAGGWVLVARDGKKLGYVDAKAIACCSSGVANANMRTELARNGFMNDRLIALYGVALSLAALIMPFATTLARGQGQVQTEVVLNTAHTSSIESVAFSPNGLMALSGSADHTLKLWDLRSSRVLRTFVGHSSNIQTVAFSPDGQTALSGAYDGSMKLWDVASGKLLRTFQGHSNSVSSVAFSPDGRTALSGSADDTLKLWDVASGRPLRTFTGHSIITWSVAFSPDGRMALSGSGDKTLKLWDVASGKLLRTFQGHSNSVSSVAFSPDGRTALSGSWDKTLKLWDVASGRLLRTLAGHSDQVFSVAFSPDGRMALSGSYDLSLKLWDVASGRPLQTLFPGKSIGSSVAFSPDGRTALLGGKLWDIANGRELRTIVKHADFVPSVVFSPDARMALSGSYDKTMKLWDVASGRLLTSTGHSDAVWSVALAPDGRTALSTSRDKGLRLWDIASGRVLWTAQDANIPTSPTFAPDGRTAISGSGDKTLKLWDVASGRLVRAFQGHSGPVWSAAFSPNGRMALSGSWDTTLKLWDVASGRLLRTFAGHSGYVLSVAFSPDGRTALSASSDNTVKLWDVASGALLRTFAEHSGSVYQIAFSADGRTVLSSGDGTFKLWDPATGEMRASIVAFDNDEWVTITPEGFFDASPNGAKLLSVVRGLEIYSIDQFYDKLYRPDLVQQKLAGDPQGKVRAAAAQLDLTKAAASGQVPAVKITSPRPSTTVNGAQVTIEASLTDQGGGIGKVEWRINGTTLGVDTPAAGAATAGRTTAISKTLALVPGDNRIEVVAHNGQGLIASEPVSVVIKSVQEAATGAPRLYVLAVGVNDYWDSALRLNFATPDAKALSAGLRQAASKLYERAEVTTVLDADATAANLERAFAKLSGEVRAQDVFVSFMSGHGKTIDGRFYFIPQDFRYAGESSIVGRGIGQDRLQGWFARIPAQKSILLFDACESGSLIGDRIALRGMEEKTAIDLLTRAMGRTVLTATTDDKPAAEGYRGHGVFTYTLLSALGEADNNGDGVVDVLELADYVDKRVPALTYETWNMRQVPQMKIVGSNFPLVSKTALLPAVSEGPGAVIPAKPTHVVIAPAQVRQSASETAPIVIQLTAGTQVRLMESAGGWVLVARDGKRLGYVEEKAVASLQ